MLLPGAPVPHFTAPSPVNPEFCFASLGGLYIALVFLPAPGAERDRILAGVRERADLMRDDRVLVFAVLPDVESFSAVANEANGLRWFGDFDGRLRRLYQAEDERGGIAPRWVLIDPTLRLLGLGPLDEVSLLTDTLAVLGDPSGHAGEPVAAPVLIVPRLLEPDFCRALVRFYEERGGAPSGVMQDRDGRTRPVMNGHKRRRDLTIPHGPLQEGLRWRLARRLVPEIANAFQFQATRIERYIVACYDAVEGGFFLPHRDNTTIGTAHRRFAVSINLNSEFEGGDLRFPEYGPRTYRPPTGGAVVFSCSLLHEAMPVVRGRRYATLPFLYDEPAHRIRTANLSSVAADTVFEAD